MAGGYRGSVVGSLQRLFADGRLVAQGDARLLERFLAAGDEGAFEAIVARHGPMVLGVCRRVLDDPHDVEDAFQATFLVLVRRAKSIRDRDVLATWLHGVARRVAVRAKVNARRRQEREQAAAGGMGVDAEDRRPGGDPLEAAEVRSAVDEEVARLPQRYRAPVVLCDLEGQSQEQAAAELRCPVGTVKSRLSRGRARLRDRLARRGLVPAAIPLAVALAADRASAVPAADLAGRTVASAVKLAAGRAGLAGAVSAEVVALVEATARPALHVQWKSAAAAAMTVTLAAAGARALVRPAPVRPPAPPPREAQSIAPSPPAAETGWRTGGGSAEPGMERFQLANGLKVIVRPIAGADRVALVVLYSIGENHDPAGRSGLGHMVEHLYLTAAAAGEEARTTSYLARRYPAGANAQTGDRYTALATTFPAADLGAELQDAAARMGDLRIMADDLDRERARLLEEVTNMFERVPALAALNNARELIRPAPSGGRYGGLPKHVRGASLEEVASHWQRYYKPRNAVIVLAGAVDPVAARREIEARFGGLPPGDPPPVPREFGPPQPGATRALAVNPLQPGEPTACLAYRAPRPGDGLYAPFLVLVTRLWAGAHELGDVAALPSPVYFTPLDDGTIVAVSAPARPGETAAQAFARLETFVARALEPPLGDGDLWATRARLGLHLGLDDFPDRLLAQNPYGVAFSLGRREQLGIDPTRLRRALDAVTDRDLRFAADAVFAPRRHAATLTFVTPTRGEHAGAAARSGESRRGPVGSRRGPIRTPSQAVGPDAQ